MKFLTNLLMIVVLAIAIFVLISAVAGADRAGRAARALAGAHAHGSPGLVGHQRRHRTLPQRLGASAVIVVGIAGVVGVLVATAGDGRGLPPDAAQTGGTDTAIVMRGGSQRRCRPASSATSVARSSSWPASPKDAQGEPIASPELVVVANLPKKADATEGNVQMRGVGEQAWAVRPQVKIIERQEFTPGLRELIVGQGAARNSPGSSPARRSTSATSSGRSPACSHRATRTSRRSGATRGRRRRHTARQQSPVGDRAADVARRARSAQGRLEANPRLKVDAKTTRDYFSKQSEGLTRVIKVMGIVIGVIMAIGAMFGALNTMFAAVAARAREIATLRAIGFRGLPVVVAVMLETMLLALIGGLLGAFVAWLIFNGYTVSTLGQNFSQVVFEFKVSPELLWTGLKWALAIGFIGGLFPAMRAARLPVTTALREL